MLCPNEFQSAAATNESVIASWAGRKSDMKDFLSSSCFIRVFSCCGNPLQIEGRAANATVETRLIVPQRHSHEACALSELFLFGGNANAARITPELCACVSLPVTACEPR